MADISKTEWLKNAMAKMGWSAEEAEAVWNSDREIDKGKKQLDHYIEAMKEIGGRSEAELETLRNKNWGNLATQWAKMINDMRDKMENDVVDHFSDCADWASHRITVNEVKDYV